MAGEKIEIITQDDIASDGRKARSVAEYIDLRNETYADQILRCDGRDPDEIERTNIPAFRKEERQRRRNGRNQADDPEKHVDDPSDPRTLTVDTQSPVTLTATYHSKEHIDQAAFSEAVKKKADDIGKAEKPFDEHAQTVFAVATNEKGRVIGGARLLISPKSEDFKLDFEVGKDGVNFTDLLKTPKPPKEVCYGQIGGIVVNEALTDNTMLASILPAMLAKEAKNRDVQYIIGTIVGKNLATILRTARNSGFASVVFKRQFNFNGDTNVKMATFCNVDDTKAMETLDDIVTRKAGKLGKDYIGEYREGKENILAQEKGRESLLRGSTIKSIGPRTPTLTR